MTQDFGIGRGAFPGGLFGNYSTTTSSKGAEGTKETQGIADFSIPDDLPVSTSNTDSSTGVPTTEQIQTAFDAIDWDKPNMVDILKLLHMVGAHMKAAQNESKWAETQAQISSLYQEAAKMKDAAVAQFATTLATSVASMGLSAYGLKSSVSQFRQVNALKGSYASNFSDANSNFSQAMQADITQIQAKGQINQAIIQMGEGALKMAGAGGQFAADMHNAEGRKDAAEAQLRSANAESSKQAEQTADEFCRKAREFVEQVLQARNSTEQAINSKM